MSATLWFERQWCPKLQCTHNRSLLFGFTTIRGITTKKLYCSNYCRMYTCCITTSDLATLKGTKILLERVMGKWRATSPLKWPYIPKPPPLWWADFRYCIHKFFSTLCLAPNRQPIRLDMPLGTWHDSPRHTTYDFHLTQSHAFTRNGPSFLRYRLLHHNVFMEDGHTSSNPRLSHPINAQFDQDKLSTNHKYDIIDTQTPPPP